MFQIIVDRSINKLILFTSRDTDRFFLETKTKQWAFLPFKKQWGWQEKVMRIYDNRPSSAKQKDGSFKYIIGLGWTAYILGVFKDRLLKENYDQILKEVILSDTYRDRPFNELRDYQNEDVLFLLKYKIGLMVVNTGYGKTQTIATLANYAHNGLGKKVLLVCPSTKARDELVKRCKNVFNLTVSDSDKTLNGSLDCIITSGLMNSKKYKDPAQRVVFEKLLETYDWVLVDEVEYTINDAGFFLFDHCIGADHFYGFSGTADKYEAKVLSFQNGLSSESVINNKNLLKYFGPSLIYRLPLNIDITRISVKSKSFDNLQLDYDEIEQSSNIYFSIMNAIWTDQKIGEAIEKVVKHFPMTFIPINNLNFIIDDWIKNHFLGKFRILLVHGKKSSAETGYTYYDLSGNTTELTLQESCDYIKNGQVDVIPSTSSGYRALDFPGLENILLVSGKVAGVTLQSIGRVARGKHMNIITIDPTKKSKKIPVYTKGAIERDNMIKEYYKFCEIKEQSITEDEL
jgi:hypothetical protein